LKFLNKKARKLRKFNKKKTIKIKKSCILQGFFVLKRREKVGAIFYFLRFTIGS